MKEQLIVYIEKRIGEAREIRKDTRVSPRSRAMADGAVAELMAIKRYIERTEEK